MINQYSNELIQIVRLMLTKEPFMRVSLKKILKHPTLWKFNKTENQDLGKIAKNFQKEVDDQN
jgi:hypothetical protein